MRSRRRPLVLRVVGRLLGGGMGEDILSDLEESFHEIRAARGRLPAQLWLWRQALRLDSLRLLGVLRRRGGRRPAAAGTGGVAGWGRRLRHAAKGLARRPGFTLAVVVTLALGIGANTAIFSVVDGILLEPLPYPEGDRLVFVWGEADGDTTVVLSGPQAAETVDLEAFSGVAQIFGYGATSMVRDELPEPLLTLTVGHTFFDVLGVPPLLGRGFRPEDEYKLTNAQIRDPGFERPIGAMVISHELWRRAFGGDPDVLGRVIRVAGHRKEIVGVMPPGFRTHLPAELQESDPADAWVMSAFDQPSFPRDTRFVRVVGRLRDGATLADAQGNLDRLSAWQRRTFAEDARDDFRMRAALLRQEAGATARGPLLILLAAVGLVLLIACANVATLFMVRAAERDGEMRIRRALGASRGELAGISLAESLLAATLGAAAGVGLAPVLTRLLLRLAPPELPRVGSIEIDGSVLAFTAVVTLAVALAAGLFPSVRASGAASARAAAPRPDARLTTSRRQRRVGSLLVVTEVALAVVLATGTGLLLRSLGNVLAVDPGFETAGTYAWQADLTTPTHPTWESRLTYFRGVQEALLSEPGVTAAGIMTPVPFDGADRVEVRLGMEEDARRVVADLRRTGPGAMEALGIGIVQGRSLEWRDLEDFDRLHAVVDRRFADRAWPGESPVGEVIGIVRREYGEGSRVWDEWKRVEVVGVAEPIRGRDVRLEDPPTVYVTYSQNMWGSPAFLARSEVPLTEERVREVAARADRRPLVRSFRSLDAVADQRLGELRFALTLIGLFAALGLVLAATGVYGLLAYAVGSRQRELHLRAALGARRGELSRMILRSGLALTGAGVVAGWIAAGWLTRFVASLLYGVTPTDPATFLAVAGFLVGVASLASWIPSRRAGRADPAAALR